jgi:transaldolase
MTSNPLRRLGAFGQSVWIDFIERGMLDEGGELARLISEDGVSGVTTNPSIFDKALAAGDAYAQERGRLAAGGVSPAQIVDVLMRQDVARAADLLRPVYERTEGRDGFVSLEVSPQLAHDTAGTVAAARAAWAALDRPNVMIKVPATVAGVAAIRELIAAGVNINATLLFSVPRYVEVARAFRDGLAARAASGQPIARIASVASFFLSRIDSLIDARLPAGDTLRGTAAIACARLAYREFQRWTAAPDWLALAARGAQPQRLLWASTSTKNPAYSDVMYVEALIGPQTVNTLPRETLDAYRDHGDPASRLTQDADGAEATVQRLRALGIDPDAVAAEVEADGVRKFAESEQALLRRIA